MKRSELPGSEVLATNNTFDVTASGISFQIGANSGQDLDVSIDDMQANQLGTAGLKIDAIRCY
ncbi:MAG: hypothetical protein ACOX2X_00590 [Peptococcia bacterium]